MPELETKKRNLYLNFISNYSILLLWAFIVVYSDVVLPFELLSLRYLIGLLGLNRAFFGFLDLLVDLGTEGGLQYAKSVIWTNENNLRRADTISYLILIGSVLGLILAKMYGLPCVSLVLRPHLGRDYGAVPLGVLGYLKTTCYGGWSGLVALYLTLYILVRLKIYAYNALDASLHRRLELGTNQMLESNNLQEYELHYKKQFENYSTMAKRILYPALCFAYTFFGPMSLVYLYHNNTPEIYGFMAVYVLSLFLSYYLWFLYLKKAKTETYDYSFLRGFSLYTIGKDLYKILCNTYQALKKKLTGRYTSYEKEVKWPFLGLCILLCLNIHTPAAICFKILHELNYTRENLSAQTIAEIFRPKNLYNAFLNQGTAHLSIVSWIFVFEILKVLKNFFLAQQSDASTLADIGLYVTFLWVLTGYYCMLEYSPYWARYFLALGVDLSVMRSLFIAVTLYYRLAVYRLYLRSVFNKKSAELIANAGFIVTLIAVVLKRILPPYVYLLGTVGTTTALTIYVCSNVYTLRKRNHFKNLHLDILHMEPV